MSGQGKNEEEKNGIAGQPVDKADAVPTGTLSTGAAADAADRSDRFRHVPRILRYALLAGENAAHVTERLIAEIDEVCPWLEETASWASSQDLEATLALAALDRRAVTGNEPVMRSLADTVRLLGLPTPGDANLFDQHCRVTKALVLAFRRRFAWPTASCAATWSGSCSAGRRL